MKPKGQGAIGWISLFASKPATRHKTSGVPTASLASKSVTIGDTNLPDWQGLGFIALELKESGQEVFGLFDGECVVNDGWSVDDVEEIIFILCTAYNDKANSRAFELSCYKP
jgi:hypothetical protein